MGGRGWAGWSQVKGWKWDNCNSIINKYIFKKLKQENIEEISKQGIKLSSNEIW